MRFDPLRELDSKQALLLVREIIDLGGVRYGRHVTGRMSGRSFTIRDVLYILRNGKVVQKEFDADRQNWKYTIQGEDLEGVKGSAVTAIISNRELFLITVC